MEGSFNQDIHLELERSVLLKNMKTVYDVGTQILKDLDVEIDELRNKLRNS